MLWSLWNYYFVWKCSSCGCNSTMPPLTRLANSLHAMFITLLLQEGHQSLLISQAMFAVGEVWLQFGLIHQLSHEEVRRCHIQEWVGHLSWLMHHSASSASVASWECDTSSPSCLRQICTVAKSFSSKRNVSSSIQNKRCHVLPLIPLPGKVDGPENI